MPSNRLFPTFIKRRTAYATVKVYGKLAKTATHDQRYWHTRKDGIKQRYHHKITKTYERYREKIFTGRREDLKDEIAEWVKEQQEDGWEWTEKEDESI